MTYQIIADFYTNGEYLKKNPDWHVAASPWKAQNILHTLKMHQIQPQTICEVGCGAGEILRLLQQQLDHSCRFTGYEISPQAYQLALTRSNERLQFRLADFLATTDDYYDLLLVIDVLQHFENCACALRELKKRGEYKIFQLPLDISVSSVINNELIEYRNKTRHQHFFTKEIALDLLRDNGYKIIDHWYTLPPLDPTPWRIAYKDTRKCMRKLVRVTKRGLQRLPGHLVYAFNPDLAVRIFGGWRLLILAR